MSCQHTLYNFNSKRRLIGKNAGFSHMGCNGPPWIACSALGKTQFSINDDMTPNRHRTSEHAGLAVRDFACQTSLLARVAARWLALVKKTGLIEDQKRVVCGEILHHVFLHDLAEERRVLKPTAQNCQLQSRFGGRLPPERVSNLFCGDQHPIIGPETGLPTRRHAPV